MNAHAPDPWEPTFGYGMNAAAASQSRTLFIAAENLLVKAERSLAEDEERARRLVRRALALGYDPHEETVPALQMATYRLFAVVVDAAEGSAIGDERWLDLVDRHLAAVGGLVGLAVVEVLAELCDDGELHDLEEAERYRLRRIVVDARRRGGRGDVEGDRVEHLVPEDQRQEFVMGLLRVIRGYRADAESLLADS